MKKPIHEYKKVAVIGCGFIGYSWGVAFARKGLETWMYNRPSKTLDTVEERMRGALQFLAEEGVISEEVIGIAMNNVHITDEVLEPFI